MLDKNALFELKIEKPDENIYREIKNNWDKISKPIDGLGDFEDLICKIGAIQRRTKPLVDARTSVIFCADNGIVEEGVSQSDKAITLAVAKALGNGISSACQLGRFADVPVHAIDIGIDCDEEVDGVQDKKVAKGTMNFLKDAAMNEEQTLLSINHGIDTVKELSRRGFSIIATGEMGIGNTTTAAAVLSAALMINSDEITGRGAGLDDEGLSRKRKVIQSALKKYAFESISDEKEKAFSILQSVGGLDIAGLVGMFIGGAMCHIPIVIDGVITSSAAVIAQMLVPGVSDYMLASHQGREKGNLLALQKLGLKPYLNGNMALGEGTGAIMLFPLLDMVMDFYVNGAKFSDYNIEEYERLS